TEKAAVRGETDMRPACIPVYKVRNYYLPIVGPFDLSDEETAFSERIKKEERFDIPDQFWNFRRRGLRAARSSVDGKQGFLESYPLTPAEAYQASGLCSFDRDSLEYQQLNYACKPVYVGEIKLISVESGRVDTSGIIPAEEAGDLPDRKSGRGGNRFWIWEMP